MSEMEYNTKLIKRNGFSGYVFWIVFTFITLLFVFLYHNVISYLVYNWSIDENYSHGYLIPFISAYLVWDKRDVLKEIPLKPNNLGAPFLLFGILLMIAGDAGAELFTSRVSMLFVIGGLVLYLLGKDFLKALLFPIVYLIFMIPLPKIVFNSVAFPLQLFAAKISTALIDILGIPVFRDGNLIHLSYNTLEVTEACSGIRSLITMLALSVIFAYFTQNRLWKKLALVLSSIPIAIFTNVIRVTGTAMLAHYVGIAYAQGFYHTFSGWFLFISALALLFLTSILLKGTDKE